MQTLTEDYLTLRLIRLKPREAWANQGWGFSLVIAKGGAGRYVSRSAVQNLLPGDVLLLNSTDGGKIAPSSDEMIFWCFSVGFEHLISLLAVGEIRLLQNTTENLKGPRLYPASSSLAQDCHRLVASAPPQGNLDHRSHVLTIAAAVLSVEFKKTRSRRVGFVHIEDHMMQVFEDLSSNELLTLSVGDMAGKFSCSRRHLNRLFHQHFGCSVGSLRMEIRLLKSVSLLRDPDAKIINVAEQCGFNHLGLFNACFKKRFGSTPRQWRKSASHGEVRDSVLVVGNPSCPMHANGLCPWTPTRGDGNATARKTISIQKSSRPKGPANPKMRESILRNIREVSGQMGCGSTPGSNVQNAAPSS